MLVLVAVSFLLSHPVASPSHTAQAKKPAQQKPQDPIRKWMDAPVYYMSYHMHYEGASAYSGGSASEKRDVDGTITLAAHTPGPTLSAQSVITAGMNPNEFSNWGSWMAGMPPPDEPQTDANMLKYTQEWVQGWRGSIVYHSDRTYDEPVSESDEVIRVHEVVDKTGSGSMQNSRIQPTLEISSKTKKFRIRIPILFDNPSDKLEQAHYEMTQDRKGEITHVARDEPLWQAGPDVTASDTDIYGTLPTSGVISCQQQFPATTDNTSGTVTITLTFSPTRAEPVELIIDPPKDYNAWRPKGGKDEKDPGNTITIGAHLQKVGGGTPKIAKLSKLEYKLKYTSQEPGVCMNSPKKPIEPPPLDFKILSDANKTLIIDSDEQGAKDTAIPDNKFDGSVTVTSFDYGATAELEVTGYLANGVRLQGIVKGTTDQSVYLPKRNKPNSYIALSYLDKYGVKNLSDNDDSEDSPVGNGFNGDGLTLYEEYRGFMSGKGWTDCDPTKKELFVVNTMRGEPQTWRGISIYEKASKIKVFRYTKESQVDDDQVVNFNYKMRPHVVDQHALFIVAGPLKQSFAQVVKVGPPVVAKHVEIPPDFRRFQKVNGGTLPYFALSLAHEMLHGSSVNHHGNIDVNRCLLGVATPTLHWEVWNVNEVEDPVTHQSSFSLRSRESNNVVLKKEDGTVFPPKAGLNRVLWVGVPGGQHSGNNDCLMKYDCAVLYKSGNETNVYYWIGGDEHAGLIVCDSPDGTGVNDPNRTLPAGHAQPRYGQAGLGDCERQICINDLYKP